MNYEVSTSFRVTRLTAKGRGAFATLRIAGPLSQVAPALDAFFHPANSKPFTQQKIDRVLFGRWGDDVCEDVVLCRMDEGIVDLHCHGGEAATNQIIEQLNSQGCISEPWTSYLESSVGLLEAECQTAIARATTLKTASYLISQQSGILRESIGQLLPEEVRLGLEPVEPWLDQSRDQLLQHVNDLLKWGRFGIHLTNPWKVVLVGRPNVGKSSLLNALMGYVRSIVFDQPGTTRDYVSAETAFDGWPIELTDTAGLRDADSGLEQQGIERTYSQAEKADLILLLLDYSQPATDDDKRLLKQYPEAIVVAHKSDLPQKWQPALPASALHVSSITNDGIDQLAQQIVASLIPSLPDPTQAFPVTTRQLECLKRMRTALEERQWADYQQLFEELLG